MSAFSIDDLLVAEKSRNQELLRDLNNQELTIAGGASAGASAAADYNDAVAASGSTTRGNVYARAEGSSYYSYYDRTPYGTYSGYSSYGPSANVSVYERTYYYY